MNVNEISINLFNQFESDERVKHEVVQYPGILALFALLKTAENTNDEIMKNRVLDYIRKFPESTKTKNYNFMSYKIGGIAAAYAFYKGYLPEWEPFIREYAEEAMNAPRDVDGLMKSPHIKSREQIWIDSIMAETPFLLYCGLALNEPRYIDEAVKQAIGHYDVLLDHETGLVHQCRNFVADGTITEDHWGRGNGWGFIALTELVAHLPKDHKDRRKVELYFSRHAYALRKYQTKHGLWRQEIPCEYAYEESSGTGLFLYGFSVGMQLGLLDRNSYMKCVQDGLKGLMTFAINPDFSTERCCRGMCCPGFGEDKGTVMAYIQTMPRSNDGHSFGTMMLAFQEAFKIGINDVERIEAYLYNPEWDV